MILYTFDPFKKRQVMAGEILKNETGAKYYYKKVTAKSKLHKFNCYGIQSDIFNQCEKLGVEDFLFDSGKQKLIYKHKIGYPLREINLGHGKQILFSINRMEDLNGLNNTTTCASKSNSTKKQDNRMSKSNNSGASGVDSDAEKQLRIEFN